MTKTAIAGQLNIGEATVYRILAAASKQKFSHWKRANEWLRVHAGKRCSVGMRLSLRHESRGYNEDMFTSRVP